MSCNSYYIGNVWYVLCPEHKLFAGCEPPCVQMFFTVRGISVGHLESTHTTLTCTPHALGGESGQGLCQECLSKQMVFSPDLYCWVHERGVFTHCHPRALTASCDLIAVMLLADHTMWQCWCPSGMKSPDLK